MTDAGSIVFWLAALTALVASGFFLLLFSALFLAAASGAFGGGPPTLSERLTGGGIVLLSAAIFAVPIVHVLQRLRGRAVPRAIGAMGWGAAAICLFAGFWSLLAGPGDSHWFGLPLFALAGAAALLSSFNKGESIR